MSVPYIAGRPGNRAGILVVIYFLLHVAVALCSWIISTHGGEARTLCSADGLRWAFSHFVSNISAAPWAELLLGIITVGIVTQSGILHSMSSQATLKQKRALSLALLVLLVEGVVLLCLLLPPAGVLLSPLGTITHSPLVRGWYGMLCLAVVVVSNVFALSSGRFVSLADTVEAHVALLHRCLPSIPPLIVLSQVVAALDYTHLLPAGSAAATAVVILSYLATVVACVSKPT